MVKAGEKHGTHTVYSGPEGTAKTYNTSILGDSNLSIYFGGSAGEFLYTNNSFVDVAAGKIIKTLDNSLDPQMKFIIEGYAYIYTKDEGVVINLRDNNKEKAFKKDSFVYPIGYFANWLLWSDGLLEPPGTKFKDRNG